MIEYDSHFSIIFEGIGREIVTPDEYLRIIHNYYFCMEVWFADHSPVPRCELSLTGSIGVIVCRTDFDFFACGYEARDNSEYIFIVEGLYIEDDALLS